MTRALPLVFALLLAGCECATRVNPVTGKSELSLFSDEDEVALGAQAAPGMEQEAGGLYRDPDLERHVAAVGAKLAAASDRKGIPYRYRILNSGIVNAFALPGGYVYVSRGLLLRMKEECELAAVLGHETGHVAARHGIRHLQVSMGINLLLNLGARAAQRAGPDSATAAQTGFKAAQLITALGQLKYGRDDEREADHLGIRYAERGGWDPRGMVGLMRILQATEKGEPSAMEALTRTHPLSSERIQNAEAELAGRPASGVRSTPEFDRLVATLREREKAQEKHQQARQRKGAEGLALVDEAIRLDPSQAPFFATRALLRPGTPEGRADAERAAGMDPALYEAQLALGLSERDPAASRAALLRARALWPSNPAPARLLGQAAERQGRRDEASGWYSCAAGLGDEESGRSLRRLNPRGP